MRRLHWIVLSLLFIMLGGCSSAVDPPVDDEEPKEQVESVDSALNALAQNVLGPEYRGVTWAVTDTQYINLSSGDLVGVDSGEWQVAKLIAEGQPDPGNSPWGFVFQNFRDSIKIQRNLLECIEVWGEDHWWVKIHFGSRCRFLESEHTHGG